MKDPSQPRISRRTRAAMKVFQALRVAYGDAEPADEKERARMLRDIKNATEQALTDGLLLFGRTKGLVEFVPLPTVWEQEQARQAAQEAAIAAADAQRQRQEQERLQAFREAQERLAQQRQEQQLRNASVSQDQHRNIPKHHSEALRKLDKLFSVVIDEEGNLRGEAI